MILRRMRDHSRNPRSDEGSTIHSSVSYTTMSASPYALPSLQALVDPSHILFGSDYPFMPEPGVADNVAGLADYDGFDHKHNG